MTLRLAAAVSIDLPLAVSSEPWHPVQTQPTVLGTGGKAKDGESKGPGSHCCVEKALNTVRARHGF